MEIIHITLGKANPERMNGINKVVHELAKQQAKSGRNVTVWGISKTGKNTPQNLPFETKIFQAYTNLFRVDKDLIQELNEKKGKCIIHLHGSWIPTFYTIGKFLEKLGIPYITMQHGGYNEIALKKGKLKKIIYFPFFEKRMIKRARLVHCIGSSEVDGLKILGFGNKAYLQPYGCEVIANETAVVKNDEHTFCFMGRLDVHTKGLDLILDAFEVFVQEFPKAKMWFIGEGADKADLDKLVNAKNLTANVKFWGALFGNEKEEIMAMCDVFLHPSRNEGLPSAIFEAANLGLPIIASKATNFGTALQEQNAGWVIENENTPQLIRAMKNSVIGSIRAKKGENAIKMVREKFNWVTTLSNFDKMYKSAFEQ